MNGNADHEYQMRSICVKGSTEPKRFSGRAQPPMDCFLGVLAIGNLSPADPHRAGLSFGPRSITYAEPKLSRIR